MAAQLRIPCLKVTRHARFLEDLGADSLDLLQLVVRIEEELGVEIADEAAECFTCVDDVLRYLQVQGEAGRGSHGASGPS